MNRTRLTKLSLGVFVTLSLMSCTKPPEEVAKAKLLAFNPQEYLNTQSTLKGRVVHKSPGDVYIILEDDTGKVLVSAHEMPEPVNCPEGATATVSGSLAQLSTEGRYYFVMDKLLACTNTAAL